ncbi:FAD-binding oxidoreductase [Streptomyces blattellae]|uniref:FAD-binding oxidoreductase n=1 Tax=Streptomyces blattellae TaxID=2569855 RepID=UPI001E2ADAF4|nr:FAD-binding oxidoreductase [Streptomyces blattellae]
MTVTASGTRVPGDEVVSALRGRFRGPILRPGDDGYDDARAIWNAMHDARPALILRATGTADVCAAVDFAREGGWTPAVRGGAHGVPGHAVCENDLMIDLSLMRAVRVDAEARVAHVQGGATWGDFDHEAQLFGLAVPGGAVSQTGVGGLTLGGGYGWLTRKYGLTLDNLRSVDIVTADGRARTVSETNEPDLFWAVRGGGGNFGIVPSFEFQLHPVGPMVLGGAVLWPFERAGEVLRFYRDFGVDSPRELGINSAVVTVPANPLFPPELHGRKVYAVFVCWNGPFDEGETVLKPLRALAEPLLDLIQPLPYTAQQQMVDQLGSGPFGRRQYWKTGYLDEFDDAAIDAFLASAEHATGATQCELNTIAGAANEVDPAATAFTKRNGRWNHVHIQCWEDASDDEANLAEARRVGELMTPHYAGGAYVNFLDVEDPARVRQAYDETTWTRLRNIKTAYDPGNLFRRNQNIPPLD